MRETKRPKSPARKPDLNTYFLAKKSGLFRPGVALVLASALLQKQSKRPMKTKG